MKYKKIICSICEEGVLSPKIDTEPQTYKNVTRDINLYYSECDCCGSVSATSDQIRLNKREMIRFEKDVDGLLSSKEIKAIRTSLELTVRLAGELFGGGPVAFSKYENDDLVQSLPMDAALRLAQSNPNSIIDLAKARNIVLPKKSTISNSSMTIPLYENLTFSDDSFSYENESKSIPVNIINFPVMNNIFEVVTSVQ